MEDHKEGLTLRGKFKVDIIRDGEVVDSFEEHNVIVNTGLQQILDSGLIGTTFYVGLLGNVSPSATTTIADVASGEVIAYDEATRQTWTKTRTAQTVSNTASPAQFTLNDTASVYGAFVATSSAKAAVTGALLSAKQFTATRSLEAGDLMSISYEITGTSS